MIMIAYRHGLRAEELVELRWDQINMAQKLIHVTRVKNGMPAVHPLKRPELAALRKLIDPHAETGRGLVFTTEKHATKMSTRSFHGIVARAGVKAQLGFPAHPHMLRHGAGYKLANDRTDTRAIQGYLGHRNIQHTVRYTELAADRFKDLWKE
jgi:type 1 fimbriae regulatory protein FimE